MGSFFPSRRDYENAVKELHTNLSGKDKPNFPLGVFLVWKVVFKFFLPYFLLNLLILGFGVYYGIALIAFIASFVLILQLVLTVLGAFRYACKHYSSFR